MRTGIFSSTFIAICLQMAMASLSQAKEVFSADDVFKSAYASNPVLSPDGQAIAFHRYFMDIMTDHRKNDLWVVQSDGESLRQISQGFDAVGAMAFTPSNKAIAFVAYQGDKSHLYLQQLDSGERIELGEALVEPANLAFSPDGNWLAFTMPVNHDHETLGEPLTPPDGAQWAEPIIVETRSQFRVDGVGYLPPARQQLFLLPTAGGKAEQVTQSTFAIDSPLEWLPDSSGLLFSANLKSIVNKPWDTDVVRFDLSTGQLTALTSQTGPDQMPRISPDGKRLAWLGHADKPGIYHEYQLYTANVDGSGLKPCRLIAITVLLTLPGIRIASVITCNMRNVAEVFWHCFQVMGPFQSSPISLPVGSLINLMSLGSFQRELVWWRQRLEMQQDRPSWV